MEFDKIPAGVLAMAGALGGDKVGFGYLFKRLKQEGVTGETIRKLIQDNSNLFDANTDEWEKWADLFTKLKLGKHLTRERFEAEFQKHMPDVVIVVKEEPGGEVWFDSQLAGLRIKLGVDIKPLVWRPVKPSIDKP